MTHIYPPYTSPSSSKHGLDITQTCTACPEQYDVYRDGAEVGYLRLRHGHFTAEASDALVYEADTVGDGCFESSERELHMENALNAIAAKLTEGK